MCACTALLLFLPVALIYRNNHLIFSALRINALLWKTLTVQSILKRSFTMKATGIVRRIDDLGRVVIPKEIRRTMHIREGDPLEIFTDKEGRSDI